MIQAKSVATLPNQQDFIFYFICVSHERIVQTRESL